MPPSSPAGPLSPADAQRIQAGARTAGRWLMWFVSSSHREHPGKAVAWAIAADPHGGTRVPGELVADTLEELRRLLPTGVTRREPMTTAMPESVVETWD